MSQTNDGILWVITAMRDALESLAAAGDFHAKVTLHHFYHIDSQKKWDALKNTVGVALIESARRKATSYDLQTKTRDRTDKSSDSGQ